MCVSRNSNIKKTDHFRDIENKDKTLITFAKRLPFPLNKNEIIFLLHLKDEHILIVWKVKFFVPVLFLVTLS